MLVGYMRVSPATSYRSRCRVQISICTASRASSVRNEVDCHQRTLRRECASRDEPGVDPPGEGGAAPGEPPDSLGLGEGQRPTAGSGRSR
jgi:hypothetical protein